MFKPVRACLATATQEGLIRFNPARDVSMPYREPDYDDEEELEEGEVKAMTRDTARTVPWLRRPALSAPVGVPWCDWAANFRGERTGMAAR